MNKSHITIIILCIFVLAAVALLFYLAGAALVPVAVALLLAYLLDPLVGALERRGINRVLAMITVFLTLVVGFAALLLFLISSLTTEFRTILVNLPEYAVRLYGLVPDWLKEYLDISTPDRIYQHLNRSINELRGVSFAVLKEAFSVVSRAFSSTLSFVLTVLGYGIIPVYLFYFLKDLKKFQTGLTELVPERYREQVCAVAGEVGAVLSAFMRGQMAVCAILAFLYSIGLFFIGIDLAILIGTIAGISFIVPYLGTLIGIVLAMLMAALKFHDLLHPFLCLGWFVLVQAVEGSVLTPRIVGGTVGLHPVVIILAVIIGGQLLGIVGMLLAVPVAAVLNVFSRRMTEQYRQSQFYRGW